jgi:crotonobetainyl-CoA:carnitine CoA-transferase CaiB-like acyl-CoA transferase
MRDRTVLEAVLIPLFLRHGTTEWLRRLEAAGVPAGPVLDVAQMHADPQTLARKMVVETTHPVAGTVKTLGLPIKFSDTPGEVSRAAPILGQHTREVLRDHGFSEAEIDKMAMDGAVQMTDQ